MKPEKAWKWVYDKIQRDWKSLYFPESKKIAKEKYDAVNLLFKEVKK